MSTDLNPAGIVLAMVEVWDRKNERSKWREGAWPWKIYVTAHAETERTPVFRPELLLFFLLLQNEKKKKYCDPACIIVYEGYAAYRGRWIRLSFTFFP